LLTITARVGVELEDDSLLALYRWLGGDRDLRDDAHVYLARQPVQDSMGPVETINVVVSNLIALASLATSVAAWRSSRSSRPEVTIVVNNNSVRITEPTEEELRQLDEAGRAVETGPPGKESDTSE
jgi:hypothetical protein